MTATPTRRRLATLALALLAAVASTPARGLLPADAPFATPSVEAATTGLTMVADARYTVDPAKRRVHVAVVLSATNQRTDTKTRRYFFNSTFLAVPPGTTGYRITSPGVHPALRVQRRVSTYTLLQIVFGTQLGAGATRQLKLTFDITDPGGAATRTTRIGSSLVSFGAWAYGSAGTPGGSVTVVFPVGFSAQVDAPELGKPTHDAAGNTTFTTGRLAAPLTFFAYFVADRPGSYKETTLRVTIGGKVVPITLRAWPDDAAWAKRVGSLLKRGLPALAKDIGLPWTVDQPLVVSEALSRNATGFSGRYNPPAGQIEIAYYATTFVVLHEAAHAWFDGGLLADRWASEGFASYYALRAARAIGEKKVTGDVLTPALKKVEIPLNAWATPGAARPAVENAEYAAALKLATLIGARAGPAGLQAVWQAIRTQRAAYQPTGDRVTLETTTTAPDWRGFLDLLDEQTGATYDDLWRTWVVRPADEQLLTDRASARTRYAAAVGRSGPWLLPRVVREALRAWQFDQANELLDGATIALDARAAVAAAAAGPGLTPPTTMQTDFEGQRGFAAAAAEADAELATISAYRGAASTKPVEPDLVARMGLWNSDPSGALGAAVDSFSAGDLQASVEKSAYAAKIWTSAAETGRNRILAIGASLAALLLASWLVVRTLRDRSVRRRSMLIREG